MRWYHLHDRRHEGPFTREEIFEGLKVGRYDLKDYFLPQQADQDQKSFAYLTASDVIGPDLLFELNSQKQNTKSRFRVETASFEVGQGQNTNSEIRTEKKLEALKSEFDDEIESTQLINIQKQTINVQPQSDSTRSFISQNEGSGFAFPWKWVVVVVIVAAIAGALTNTDVQGQISKIVSKTSGETDTAKAPVANKIVTGVNNRAPRGTLQLPAVQRREIERSPASIRKDEESSHTDSEAPQKKRRRSKSRGENAAPDTEDENLNQDEEEVFDEDTPLDEDVNLEEEDEIDI